MEQATGTSTLGNTSTNVLKRRNYMVTFWGEYPKELPKNAKYMCTCEDSTKDGKYHGHAFIYFKNPVTMKAVKKLFGNDAHIEKPIKNSECIAYVLNKDSRKHNFQEFGDKPMDNGIHKMSELMQLNEEDVPPLYYNVYKRAKQEEENNIDIDDMYKNVKVYWIQGPSGIGKTEKAKEIIKANKENYGTKINMVKHSGDFWIGTGNAKIALYDDFRDSDMKASEFIHFIDYNKHVLNIKGSRKINDYELIIITTVQKITDIYRNMDNEPRQQWMRRVNVIDMYDVNNLL